MPKCHMQKIGFINTLNWYINNPFTHMVTRRRNVYSVYVCIFIYRHLSKDSSHSRMPCPGSEIGMLLTKPYFGYLDLYWSKLIWSQTLFISFEHWKPVNDLRLANKITFLVLVTGFTFAAHLSYWTIYDLKEQS